MCEFYMDDDWLMCSIHGIVTPIMIKDKALAAGAVKYYKAKHKEKYE